MNPLPARDNDYEALYHQEVAARLADGLKSYKLFIEERDRRYAEVSVEREKALKIKEVADLAALQLAREIQTYKDEKANQLREQIGSERNLYVTKDELERLAEKWVEQLKPITTYVTTQQGGREGALAFRGIVAWVVAAVGGGIGIIATILALSS